MNVTTPRPKLVPIEKAKVSHKWEKEKLHKISHIKRFLERWQADPTFREKFLLQPIKTINDYNLNLNIQEINFFLDNNQGISHQRKGEEIPPSIEYFRDFLDQELTDPAYQFNLADYLYNDLRFQAWHNRQIARTSSQFRKLHDDKLGHYPVCFELSKGCSVGCWFCGLSAPRLSDIFPYNQENAKLWRECLELVKEKVGPAAASGFCYWATDPFDNPDYERFCLDFQAIMGLFPSTTTAQALKNPAQTRALIKLSRQQGRCLNHFSIPSLKVLEQLYQEFTPEELAFVHIIPLNEESSITKTSTGRAREKYKKYLTNNEHFLKSYHERNGTIACVSGFLFNLVDKSVKLISPCPASDCWPNGYIVYDEGHFSTIKDLENLLERIITNNMAISLKPNFLLKFRSDLTYEKLVNGFRVSTRFKKFTFTNQSHLQLLGDVIKQENHNLAQVMEMFESLGVASDRLLNSLNGMFAKGILSEEP